MSIRVCTTGHIKDPVPLIQKSRASCPGGRVPSSLIHQVVIITGLNKLYTCTVCSRPEDKTSTQAQTMTGLEVRTVTLNLAVLHAAGLARLTNVALKEK